MNLHGGDIRMKNGRNARTCENCFWPKSAQGTVDVPYKLSSSYSATQLNFFQTAMDEFETLTCVRFVPRTTEQDYINIVSSEGCSSFIGKIGGGQKVALDTAGCLYRGTIQHELNHALGFHHEHTRGDRDDYITINFQNIEPAYSGNFKKEVTNNLGVEYDYGSVMHYDSHAFSRTRQPTIETKPVPGIPIGQRDGLSILDVSKINRLYQCDVCANLHNDHNGRLNSANYPSSYPHNTNCVWLIRTPSGQVSLTFAAFDIQSSPDCTSDYIKIYDGPTKRSPILLDKTCGTGLIPPIIASTNQLLVEFSSDSSVAGVGFTASYSSVRCGGTFYTPRRNITTPGYPNSYSPGLQCNYTIVAPVGQKVYLTVDDFELEQDYFCTYDVLRVHSGDMQYGPYCGTKKVLDITSTENTLSLIFKSDTTNERKGFKASYTFI
ncbi:embryonic protein UVS.2-like [Engystomops pustulosus]|uniref:embryonic protein UVS.2-like n=1 Tax=Engystomops pustulosus TaxID=76066 RepID=UPI003AFAE942